MKTQKLFLTIVFLFFFIDSYSQGFLITSLKVVFDGNQLVIDYDIVDKNQSNQFYVWVEMQKKNGEIIRAEALAGDIGEKVKAGTDKKIAWVPADDSVFLNEEILVEVKAEKYIKEYNKGKMMLLSTVVPGLGQTKMSKGKPYWLTGVAAYGAITGGLMLHQMYLKTYDEYRAAEDPVERKDLYNKTQMQKNLSGGLIVSGAAIWAANLIWVAAIPNRYKPLKNISISMDCRYSPGKSIPLLTFKVDF